MVFEVIQSLGLASLLALLFLALVLASEVGHRLGARFGRGRHGDKDAATLATAAFAPLALLVAFTYPMALTRYDMRRTVVLEQADALRDAARVAPLLPDGAGTPMLDDLRRAVDLAIGLGIPCDPAKFDADTADTADVSTKLWGQLAGAARDAPTPLPVHRMTSALQRLDDATERRVTALRNHAPPRSIRSWSAQLSSPWVSRATAPAPRMRADASRPPWPCCSPASPPSRWTCSGPIEAPWRSL